MRGARIHVEAPFSCARSMACFSESFRETLSVAAEDFKTFDFLPLLTDFLLGTHLSFNGVP